MNRLSIECPHCGVNEFYYRETPDGMEIKEVHKRICIMIPERIRATEERREPSTAE